MYLLQIASSGIPPNPGGRSIVYLTNPARPVTSWLRICALMMLSVEGGFRLFNPYNETELVPAVETMKKRLSEAVVQESQQNLDLFAEEVALWEQGVTVTLKTIRELDREAMREDALKRREDEKERKKQMKAERKAKRQADLEEAKSKKQRSEEADALIAQGHIKDPQPKPEPPAEEEDEEDEDQDEGSMDDDDDDESSKSAAAEEDDSDIEQVGAKAPRMELKKTTQKTLTQIAKGPGSEWGTTVSQQKIIAEAIKKDQAEKRRSSSGSSSSRPAMSVPKAPAGHPPPGSSPTSQQRKKDAGLAKP